LPNKPAQNPSRDDSKKTRSDEPKQGISNHNFEEEDARQSKVIPFPTERHEGRGRDGQDESSHEEK
jgi:hypothetical protein